MISFEIIWSAGDLACGNTAAGSLPLHARPMVGAVALNGLALSNEGG
jgi:hypothetical protein